MKGSKVMGHGDSDIKKGTGENNQKMHQRGIQENDQGQYQYDALQLSRLKDPISKQRQNLQYKQSQLQEQELQQTKHQAAQLYNSQSCKFQPQVSQISHNQQSMVNQGHQSQQRQKQHQRQKNKIEQRQEQKQRRGSMQKHKIEQREKYKYKQKQKQKQKQKLRSQQCYKQEQRRTTNILQKPCQLQYQPKKAQQELKRSQQFQNKQTQQSTPSFNFPSRKTPSQEKPPKYLSNQIKRMGLSSSQTKAQFPEILNSPIIIQRSFSLRTNDSSIIYQPQSYALNLSRSYIPNFRSLGNPTIYEFTPAGTQQTARQRIKQIFDYYAQTYLQPTQNYDTFDCVRNRTINFQAFCLFAKDFNLLRTIFSVNTIKKIFKKHSRYGKVLQLTNFVSMIQGLAHQKQSNAYFKLQQMVPGMNDQTSSQLEIQELYAFIGIYDDPRKLREKFSKVFHPFNCQKGVQLPKIKFIYRKFSQPDLHRKALPQPKQRKFKKSLVVLKSGQKYTPSPFKQAKSIVVSWQTFNSKSTQKFEGLKRSLDMVKKYVKQDPDDKVYLKQYRQMKSIKTPQRQLIQKKINEMKQIWEKKSNVIISKLQRRESKILSSNRKTQQQILNKKL